MFKKALITALVLLLSQQSLAQGFYLVGKYHYQFFDNRSLEVKNSSGSNTEGQKISDYKLHCESPFSVSIALGYAEQGEKNEYRFEMEGIYSQVKVNHNNLSGLLAVYYNKAAGNKSGDTNNPIEKNGYELEISNAQYDIENSSTVANVYYYWKNDQFSFAPYIGAGIGGTRMEMFGEALIRPAYQLRVGLNYRMTEGADIHMGYRHFGVVGGTLELTADKLKIGAEKEEREGKKESLQIASKLFATHGLEFGITVHFASSH